MPPCSSSWRTISLVTCAARAAPSSCTGLLTLAPALLHQALHPSTAHALERPASWGDQGPMARLVAPLVDGGHGDVVDNHRHGPAARGAVRAALALLHAPLRRSRRARVSASAVDGCGHAAQQAVLHVICDRIHGAYRVGWVGLGSGYMGRARASMACWKMAGVVSEEKVTVLAPISSGGQRPRNWLMVDVLAVPGPPTSRVACRARGVAAAGAAGVHAAADALSAMQGQRGCGRAF